MTETTQTIRPERGQPALSPPRSANGRTPLGYRVLHVIVPESIFNYVKAQAYLSGMRFPEYVANVLKEAKPYLDQRTKDAVNTQVPKSGSA